MFSCSFLIHCEVEESRLSVDDYFSFAVRTSCLFRFVKTSLGQFLGASHQQGCTCVHEELRPRNGLATLTPSVSGGAVRRVSRRLGLPTRGSCCRGQLETVWSGLHVRSAYSPGGWFSSASLAGDLRLQ